ncbi:hypothetical protein Lalb_Chr17g0337941 [Lupinus albus]|uniref:Uncharacterized protein n=1 Tax=Lupinus albus TaxID=3870 RepID=A0A6A4P7R8_LUPAL|nr:hypothetical protein Lalb_Chr17g0337941 [Lupinus albus]
MCMCDIGLWCGLCYCNERSLFGLLFVLCVFPFAQMLNVRISPPPGMICWLLLIAD